MRIAFHFPRLASGGVEKMRIVLATELLSRGFEVDFVLCQAQGEYLDQVPPGVRIVDLKAGRTLTSIFPLVRYLRTVRPEWLVSSLGPQNIVAILAARLARSKTKVFVTQHNALTRQSSSESLAQRVVPLLYRRLLPLADGVIAVSHGIAEDMSRACRFPIEKISVIHNPAYMAQEPEDGLTPVPFGAQRFILAIGRLVEQKGYDDLLAAFAVVAEADQDVHLVILGNGPLLAPLQSYAVELGINARVHFMGFVKDPRPFLAQCKVFVLASRYEGLANVLVEALSVGAKVVSTRCDYGPEEVLAGGKFGQLVPVGDRVALAGAILSSLEKEVDIEPLVGRAKDFSAPVITDHYLRVLGNVA
ncbi:glycosyltransferase [Stenotrophomonas sp. JAG2]|uniref:glycosyltransferase n=1 Tax=Stenotrophomonas sp. JAG2 TaxID=3229243 RepID=UPI0034E1DE92